MKVDAGIGHQLEKIPAAVRAAEEAGYDGVRAAEMNHDPFFPLLLAAGLYLDCHFQKWVQSSPRLRLET